MGDHRQLVAYQLAFDVASELRDVVVGWSKVDVWSIGVQLLRSAGSIGANIAEAEGRWHANDRVRFLLFARGSLYETEHWLALAAKADLISSDYESALKQLGRVLNGLIRATKPIADSR